MDKDTVTKEQVSDIQAYFNLDLDANGRKFLQDCLEIAYFQGSSDAIVLVRNQITRKLK